MSLNSQPSYTLKEVASLTSTKLVGDETYKIHNVADLDSATEKSLSFLANRRYLSAMQRSKAGAIFVKQETPLLPGHNYLISEDPSKSFQILVDIFYADKKTKTYFEGIHTQVCIDKDASIGKDVTIGPFVTIEKGAKIGSNTTISAGSYIGAFTEIGSYCLIHPNVTIREHCRVGNHVVVQSGAVIGSCGFGYSTDEKGIHTKLDQVGIVVIEDHVEIGANTTIDRGRFTETRICKGTKIDNLVQIAHGVHIGEHNLIVAQTGIAGSSKTGKHVVMAGQSALIGHVSIADGVIIAARGAAAKSIEEPGGKYAGAPMLPLTEHNRQSVYLRNIEKYVKRIEKLEERLKTLEA
ncbi:MAG: UDP-3-O-(3-hydroxymyristoyl)glucosamine N-acyltransferase [Chlamydiales bacterium]|nr:UDP-3-O-(3-hydroxymyristoyl)glucosamine N-acyltransferase [Chlamydiales bacterium]